MYDSLRKQNECPCRKFLCKMLECFLFTMYVFHSFRIVFKSFKKVSSSSSRHPSVTNDNGLASPFDEGVFLLKEMRLDKNNTKVKEK